MGDTNPIRTLGDYSKPSHEGYRNTIELPEGNNVAPLRSDTIRLVQNGCSFQGLRSEDPKQHLKDFLKLVDSLKLDGANRKRMHLRYLYTLKTPDRRLFELEDQINFLLKGSRPTPKPSSTHTPQAYTDVVYSNPHPRNQNEPPKQKSFTFHERTGPNPQPQALGTSFVARVRDYMAAHTKRIERFENVIFKQREEINDRMAGMFGLLKELTTSRAPKKVLVREEAKYPITKNVNSISLTREEEEKNDENDVTTINDIEKTNWSDTKMPVKKAEKENKTKNGTKNETIKRVEREEVVEAPNSQPVGYDLKHMINEKLIEGLVDNHRGPVYEAILKKKITKKEDIGGNFEIPYFVILDIKEDEKMPFILGTPFLTTAKAVIKFDKGTITLRSRKSKISFHRIPESLGKVEKGIKNNIEPIAPTMTVNRLVLEWEERIKLHQEKELEFDQWRSKNFKNKNPALVKVKGEKMEGEVT
ncbi:MAK10-like protein [Tanacetum coccineum]|uniref:MAK10-like protein n=1 Tax=Tanacetum coccineum TaxID=301880 RepID=A0ABQ5HZ88_9ASTR